MKCVKCGNELQPGARFCIYCGTSAEESRLAAAEAAVSEPAPAEEAPATSAPAGGVAAPASEAEPQPQYSQPTAAEPQYSQPQYGDPYSAPVSPIPEEPEKKGKKGAAALIATVIVLVLILCAAVGALFVSKFGGSTASDTSRQLSYVKNGKLYYVKDISKDDEAVVVSSIKNADEGTAVNESGTFTDDGKYLYFYNKVESSSSGRLCRVEVSKLKADEDKNEELIEELVSGVVGFVLLDDERFVYRNDSDELYYYDGEDKNKVASDISYYYLSGEDKVLFVTNSNQVAYYSITEDETETVIDNCSYILTSSEQGYYYVVESEEDDNYSYDLRYTSEDGDTETIVSGAYAIVGAAGEADTVFYVVERTENVCYYDFVNDTYADADANLTQPVGTDYLTPCTEYDAMSDWDRQYYTTYPDDIEYFYYWLYEDYYFDTGMLLYTSSHTDENGNSVYGYYFYDEANTQWYVLDEDSYELAVDAYDGVADRASLRETLQSSTMDITYYDLYAWNPTDGQSIVATDVSPYGNNLIGESGMVVYKKLGEIGKVDWPEDTYSIWFVEDYIYECRYGTDADSGYFYSLNGEESAWNSDWGDLSGSSSVYFSVSSDGKYVMACVYAYDEDYNYTTTINALEMEDGTLSLIERDITSASSGVWVDDAYYYYEAESDSEGNLCCFANGSSSTVLKNISNVLVRRYEDGSFSAYADYDYSSGGTLKLFDEDGDSTKVDSEVSDYCYISSDLIVYRKDEKLYVYRGEDADKFKIDSSVSSYTCGQASSRILLY